MINGNAIPFVSIGLLARNEANSIRHVLKSLFTQTLFSELQTRGWQAEILCVVNGSTDNTADIATDTLSQISLHHPHRITFTAGVKDLLKPGKMNAWNEFVHKHSSRSAELLILMDTDIVLGHETTLWNLCNALLMDPHATVSVGKPIKYLAMKRWPNPAERLSLATSRMTQSTSAQLTAQLYCIRTSIARRIWLPRQLTSCDDGFIKILACTDFLNTDPDPSRITKAPDASHFFEAYVKARDILLNQKRQMMGQTGVHLLADKLLPSLPPQERTNPALVFQRLDENDPDWLRRLIAQHLQEIRYFWRLFPGILTFRFKRLAGIPGWKKLIHLPAALVGFAFTLIASWLAFRQLRSGGLDYWPNRDGPRSATHKFQQTIERVERTRHVPTF